MKKTILSLIAILISETTLAHELTAGSYKGSGLWSSKAGTGTYQISTVIEKAIVKSHYSLPDGSSRNWNFEIQGQNSQFFDVFSAGKKVGSGYCLEKVQVCHYELTAGPLKLEETLVQEGNKIYRFGSKDEGNGPIMWQERMVKE